ncbi:unnamed protein product [Acanthoscelides obtectus]|uniref:Uncharacterized protein n=1 Tax=Acanthoscelides obtectus TaxID=200917 RepID=A0A9P0Q005_ACAOB|nr:unnamed protein product [Acanthoscelides obtectus]CAK1663162.1 hypothetical protein AOBTE_LOCUS23523 [Acanthoscelides obtectus]
MSCEWLESVKRGTRSGVLRLERLKSGIRIEIGAIVLVKVEIEYIVEVPARDNVVVSKVYLTMTMEVKGNKTFEVREVYPETSYHFRYLMLCEYRLGNENLKAQIADVRDERDVRMAVQSNSMSVAADRQIDGGWGKMTGRQVANALNRFNAAQ